MKYQCRVAPSLGELEGTHEQAWGTVPYIAPEEPAVFFGLYGLPDFFALWRHQGKRAILWAGSDIKHFVNGYWLDEEGSIRIDPEPLAEWIAKNCRSYVENGVEAEALRVLGIESEVVPSFMGDIDDYPITYQQSERPAVYASVSGENFAMYGFELIEMIADRCEVDFYLYGSDNWESKHSNVFVRGRVPKEVMNEEVKNMQCGLRTLEFDGFSEIVAKSVLWGQWPITRIGYPHIDSFKTNEELIALLNGLKHKREPNTKGRDYYRRHINKYPWYV